MQTSEVLNPAGDSDSRNVLDAFFLGKALAEALNERIESTVGEFLGAISQLQAEQQKQVLDFQVVCNLSYTIDPLLILSYTLYLLLYCSLYYSSKV